MPESKDSEATGEKLPSPNELRQLTEHSTQYAHAVEFAGFLAKEDDASIAIVDKQGTWIIQRSDIAFLEDWAQWQSVPHYFAGSGRPVRIGIKEGATIHEIRPWQIRSSFDTPLGGSKFRQSVEMVFTLGGGAPLPNHENALVGERQLGALERLFARRLGWAPDPTGNPRHDVIASVSSTIVVCDGYCDQDCGF